jgi:hypothetical protein
VELSTVLSIGAIALFYYLIAKVLIALSNTWVGDLILGATNRKPKHWTHYVGETPENQAFYDTRHVTKLGVGAFTLTTDDDDL